MAQRHWTFHVAPEDGGLRLDQLVSRHTGLSRRQARSALMLGGVQVDRHRVRVAGRIPALGAEVRVATDDSLGAPPDLVIPVLYEDEWLLAVDKPAGLSSQGTQCSDRHDLLALLGRQRPGPPLHLQHRLDQGTSGVLVLAKQSKVQVGNQFRDREVRKTYLGRIARPVDSRLVDLPIGRLRQAVPARFGCPGLPLSTGPCTLDDLVEARPSLTHLRPLREGELEGLRPGHYVVAEPQTGRTHQIRVHLAALGVPIQGDGLYGGTPDDQLWLHAWRLELRHPVSGDPLLLEAPPLRFLAQEGRP